MCTTCSRINFEIRLHLKIRGRDQNSMAHRGNTWNKRSLFACDPLSIRFKTHSGIERKIRTEKKEGGDVRGERVYRYRRDRASFCRISTEGSESKLNSVKSRHFRLYDLYIYIFPSWEGREEIDSRSIERRGEEIVACGEITSSIRFEDVVKNSRKSV